MSDALTPSCRIHISSSVYVRAFGEELVLLEFGRGEYFGLDALGAEIWRGFERGETLEQICDTVSSRWDVAREDALQDIRNLVHEMRHHALVTVTP